MAKLTIKASGLKEGYPAAFFGTQVWLDGAPLGDCTGLTVDIQPNDLVRVNLSLELEELNVELTDPYITVLPSPLMPRGDVPEEAVCPKCGAFPMNPEWPSEEPAVNP